MYRCMHASVYVHAHVTSQTYIHTYMRKVTYIHTYTNTYVRKDACPGSEGNIHSGRVQAGPNSGFEFGSAKATRAAEPGAILGRSWTQHRGQQTQ